MTVRIKRKDEEMFKAFLQQCEGEVLSTQRKKSKSRATVAGEVLERASEPSPTTDSLQHVQASMSPNESSVRASSANGAISFSFFKSKDNIITTILNDL